MFAHLAVICAQKFLKIRAIIFINFNALKLRNDIGEIWENYLMIERLKKLHYEGQSPNYYFWHTYDQKEIDWIEEAGGRLAAFEFKWGNKTAKMPKLFEKSYPNSTFALINPTNYTQFIL